MKWCYIASKNGSDNYLGYYDIKGKIDLFVPCKPLRTLMVAKNTTPLGGYLVADYLTGVKLYNTKLRREAVAMMTDELAIKTQIGLDYQKQIGFDIPEVNEVSK